MLKDALSLALNPKSNSMKKLLTYLLSLFFFLAFASFGYAQDDEFNMDDFAAADDTEIKNFCNNKVINLSPTKLVSVSYDFVGGFDLDSESGDALESDYSAVSPVNLNHGLRLDANFPIISKSSIIVNATVSHWESNYNFGSVAESHGLATRLGNTPLRSTRVGAIVFKPLNEKNFMLFQFDAALNGAHDFDQFQPNFGKLKYSAAVLYGWKFNDNTNLAFGATRTYRGGRVLHIPVMLYNKTFNEKWGLELLLPARGAVRHNFSTKSLLMFGYELEGHSYFLEGTPDNGLGFPTDDLELRKSEIRTRISWDKSLSDFIWLNLQAGLRVNYRFTLDQDAGASDAIINNNIGMPLYFRVGFSLVSP